MHSRFIKDAAGGKKVVTTVMHAHDLGAEGVRYFFAPTQFVEVLPLPYGPAAMDRHAIGKPCGSPFTAPDPAR